MLGRQRDDRDERETVAVEQLRMVLSHTRLGTLAATAFALFAAALLSGSVAAGLVQAWVLAKLAVAAVRIALAQLYARRGYPADPVWRSATYTLLALDGLVWGVAGARLMAESAALAALVAAALACVTCVATFGLQIRTLATLAYVTPILGLTGIGLALRGDQTGAVGSVGMAILLAMQAFTARGAQQRFVAGVRLRLQAESLAREKQAALALAQQQSAVKSQFLAKVSHELRTPLHGILGLARLLHGELHDAGPLRRVALIEASGKHLLALINDLLDLSRIEAGAFTTRSEPFELVAQCEQLADVFAVRAHEKGLTLRLEMDLPRPCWVRGDPARLRQVLHNLLGNAVKFTERGGVRLRVGRGATPEHLRIEVIDSGSGIAEADLQRIFQAFQQSERGAAQPIEGAGLGLTIAREIAQAMGGDIVATSRLGAGSSFVFSARLPPIAPPEALPAEPAAVLPAPTLPRRVLVAEDDEVNALIVGAYLDGLGVAHERVPDGRQAVAGALRADDRPELVLMDWRMPVMDGLEATREIRRREGELGLARLPVVALTATSSADDRALCLSAGMDEVLAKPFTREQLAALLARWVAAPAR